MNIKDKARRLLNQVESMLFNCEAVKSTGCCFHLFKTRWKSDAMQMGRYDKCQIQSLESGRKKFEIQIHPDTHWPVEIHQ